MELNELKLRPEQEPSSSSQPSAPSKPAQSKTKTKAVKRLVGWSWLVMAGHLVLKANERQHGFLTAKVQLTQGFCMLLSHNMCWTMLDLFRMFRW